MNLQYLVIALCTGAAIINARDSLHVCSPGYQHYEDGHTCYKLYLDDSVTWYVARKHCRDEHGDLIVVQDEHTNTAIIKLVTDAVGSTRKSVWIGLQEIDFGPKFQWVDGTPLVYEQWRQYEPNNDSPSGTDCATYIFNDNGKFDWNDLTCSQPRPFICEKAPRVRPACPHGYVSYPDGKKCVKVAHETLPWKQARRACQEEGADLILIRDEAYNRFINSLIGQRSWIGMYADSETGTFTWVDGSVLNFTQWAQRQPDREVSEVCGEILPPTGTWNDFPCHRSLSYICERDFYNYGSARCPDEKWTLDEENEQCYKIQTNEKSFEESRTGCQHDGGDLVVIPDVETEQRIISLLDKKRYWIGLVRNTDGPHDNDNPFVWIDGTTPHNSTLTHFSMGRNELCGTLQYHNLLYQYSDVECPIDLPSICQKHAAEHLHGRICPRGYMTFFVATSNSTATCLKAETKPPANWFSAAHSCLGAGEDLFTFRNDDPDLNEFVIDRLNLVPSTYWTNIKSCEFVKDDVFHSGSCSEELPYVCISQGDNRQLVSLKDLSGVVDVKGTVVRTDWNTSISLFRDVCRFRNITHLYSVHDEWEENSSNYVSIVTTFTTDHLSLEDHGTQCNLDHEKSDCCVQASLRYPANTPESSKVEVYIPKHKLFCMCPEIPKVTKEMVSLLKEITKPKNNSAPENNLCPCRCDSMGIDFNPSQKALDLILTKIKKELKVDTGQLVATRSKKISAKDDRTESKAMGYLGIVLCIIPFCMLVVMDFSRIFHTH